MNSKTNNHNYVVLVIEDPVIWQWLEKLAATKGYTVDQLCELYVYQTITKQLKLASELLMQHLAEEAIR